MTRYGIVSDVHGNLDALDACLHTLEQRKVDEIVSLGDIVGYGPEPTACVDRVRAVARIVVAGNHDRAVAGTDDPRQFNRHARIAAIWSSRVLPEDAKRWLADQPLLDLVPGATFVHASLDGPEQFRYVLTMWDAARTLDAQVTPVAFVGHTHVPAVFRRAADGTIEMIAVEAGAPLACPPDTATLVNVGSVGQPRDGDPRASCAIFDDEARTVEFIRLPYDVAAACARLDRVGLPRELSRRLREGQ